MAAIATTPLTFQALWHPRNISHKPAAATFGHGLKWLIYTIISVVIPIIGLIRIIAWLLNRFTAGNVIPSNKLSLADKESLSQEFEMRWNHSSFASRFERTSLKMRTPDGVVLDGTHIKSRHATLATPTVVIFQPNPCIYKHDTWWKWMAEYCINHNVPCNFVLFDYRGSGDSESQADSASNLIVDGDTVLQFVEDHLRIPSDKTVVYSYSLGGGVSAEVLGALPHFRGKYISDRSFCSVEAVVRYHTPICLSLFTTFLIRSLNWNLQAAAAFARISARKFVISHPEDRVIPPSISLAAAAQSQFVPNVQYMLLRSPLWFDPHGVPLDYCFDRGTGSLPIEPVMQFILS